jgi:hypothetical protein
LSACGESGIQYTARSAIEFALNYMFKIFDYFPIHCAQSHFADNTINILLKILPVVCGSFSVAYLASAQQQSANMEVDHFP